MQEQSLKIINKESNKSLTCTIYIQFYAPVTTEPAHIIYDFMYILSSSEWQVQTLHKNLRTIESSTIYYNLACAYIHTERELTFTKFAPAHTHFSLSHTHTRRSKSYASLSCTKSNSAFWSPTSWNVGGTEPRSADGWHGITVRGKFLTIWKSSGAASWT